MRTTSSCLDENVVAALLDGCLSEAERSAAMSHSHGCESCFSLLTEAARLCASQHPEPASAQTGQAAQLNSGEKFGRYLIVGPIGHGGMGIVYAAYDEELERQIAIKVVRMQDDASHENAASRLVREAQAMARVSHPNIITVHEVGRVGEQVYIAMELVRGVPLQQWLASEKRGWSEIVKLFVSAGSGLAAAHTAGVIHRDFKPSNVLVRVGGSPVVLDFGLAQLGYQVVLHAQSLDSSEPLASSLSKEGVLLGTPYYMSPEQHQAAAVDALSDQFSFCVALWEALYGQRPFRGNTASELASAAGAGELPKRPSAAGMPSSLHATLVRGLRPDPGDRFGDMEALLDALGSAVRPRRRIQLAVVAVILTGLGIKLLLWTSPVAPPCSGANERLQGVWDDQARTAVRGSFAASKLGYSADTLVRVETGLDRYVKNWKHSYVEVCEATYLRGEQSENLLDAKMACLTDRLQAVRAVATVLGEADQETIDKSTVVLKALPSISSCSRVQNGGPWSMPAPVDPELRRQYAEIEAKAARARALSRSGKQAEATQLATQTLALARELGDSRSQTGLLFILATLSVHHRDYEAAKSQLVESSILAAKIGDVEGEAQALSLLVATVGSFLKEAEAGLAYADAARSAILRADEPPRLRANLQGYLGMLLFDKGDYEGGIKEFRQQVELLRSLGDEGSTDLATALARLGGGTVRYGEMAKGVVLLEEALAMHETEHGQDHPTTLKILHNLSYAYRTAARPDDAIAALVDLIARRKRVLPDLDPATANSKILLGNMLRDKERFDEAHALYQSAKLSLEKHGAIMQSELTSLLGNMATLEKFRKNYDVADALFAEALAGKERENPEGHILIATSAINYAIFLQEDLHDCQRANALYERGLAIFQKVLPPTHRNIAHPLIGLAACAMEQGNSAEAIAHYKRALAIREESEPRRVLVPDTRFLLAKALLVSKRQGDREQARREATRAITEFEQIGDDAHPEREEVMRWLKELGR